jgi:hypothetical protein
MKFCELGVGETFDFLIVSTSRRSYSARCRKAGQRHYVAIEGEFKGQKVRMRNLSASVYHIQVRARRRKKMPHSCQENPLDGGSQVIDTPRGPDSSNNLVTLGPGKQEISAKRRS